jgi:ATP synthase protein I
MADESQNRPLKPKPPLSQEVGSKAARKLRARRHVTRTVWFGLGMMGLIGWSVAIPTVLGAALGLWLDSRHQGSHSWTLALLVIGLDHRLFECLALGGQGRQGHAGRTGGWR